MTTPNSSVTDLSTLVGSWTLDPGTTSVEFHTKAMWVLNVKGTVKAVGGSGTVDAEGAFSGSLVLDAASIDTGKKKRDEHLRTADFLEVVKYPTVTFTATGGHPVADGKVEVIGSLTVHGRTQPLTVPARVSVTNGTATVIAEVDVDRSEWGITWSKLGAGLKNHVVVSARFSRG
jgi:polyisoprenoid-binding protein YceI